MSAETSTRLTIQKHSVSVKNSEPFNGDHSKWKWFKQAVNNKLHCNADHYLNHNDKIDYIDFYLDDKINHILDYK